MNEMREYIDFSKLYEVTKGAKGGVEPVYSDVHVYVANRKRGKRLVISFSRGVIAKYLDKADALRVFMAKRRIYFKPCDTDMGFKLSGSSKVRQEVTLLLSRTLNGDAWTGDYDIKWDKYENVAYIERMEE